MKTLLVMRSVLFVVFIGFLSGCATVDLPAEDVMADTLSQLSIDKSSIVCQQPARFASASPGDRYAEFQLGVYTQTMQKIILFSYSSDSKKLSKVISLPVENIDEVAIESWGMFNHLKQLQITSSGVMIAINFNNNSDAIAGSVESTKPPFDALLAAGVKEGEPYGRVLPNEVKHFVIPIYITAR